MANLIFSVSSQASLAFGVGAARSRSAGCSLSQINAVAPSRSAFVVLSLFMICCTLSIIGGLVPDSSASVSLLLRSCSGLARCSCVRVVGVLY